MNRIILNEYVIRTRGRSNVLVWYAPTAREAREEAEQCGHRVEHVRLVRENIGLRDGIIEDREHIQENKSS